MRRKDPISDFFAKDPRVRRQARDLPNMIAIKEVDRGIQIGALGTHLCKQRIELRVEAAKQAGIQDTFDDHRARLEQIGHDLLFRCIDCMSRNTFTHFVVYFGSKIHPSILPSEPRSRTTPYQFSPKGRITISEAHADFG
jgi:hypothetical protein